MFETSHPAGLPTCPGIYYIENTKDGKRYIGSTIRSIRARIRCHIRLLNAGRSNSRHLQAAWERDGQDAFFFGVLQTTAEYSIFGMRTLEAGWIRVLKTGSRDKGYNISPGGGYGPDMVSDETRALLRHKRKGREITEATRRKVSESRKGMQFSETHLENLRKNYSRAMHTPEAQAKRARACRGLKRSLHVVAAMADRNARDYTAISPCGEVYEFRNLTAFCREHGLLNNKMQEVANGAWGQHRGWSCARSGTICRAPAKKPKKRPTLCKRGHDLDDSYVDRRGMRHCRQCTNLRAVGYRRNNGA